MTTDKNINCSDVEVFIPNGKDIRRGVNNFMFKLTREGFMPAGTANSTQYKFNRDCINNDSNTNATNGHGCTAWVLYNENMDYLHCDDLTWNGKYKCK